MLDKAFNKFAIVKPWAGAEARRRCAVVSMEAVPETPFVVIARTGYTRNSKGKVLCQGDITQEVVNYIVEEHLNQTSFEHIVGDLKRNFNVNAYQRRLAEMEILLVEDGFNQFNKKKKNIAKPRELAFVTL